MKRKKLRELLDLWRALRLYWTPFGLYDEDEVYGGSMEPNLYCWLQETDEYEEWQKQLFEAMYFSYEESLGDNRTKLPTHGTYNGN